MSLEVFLSSPERPVGTLTHDELEGFLFAMACSPEPIPQEDWLAVVFAGKDPGFESTHERGTLVTALTRRHQEIDVAVIAESIVPRFGIGTGDAALENLGPDSLLHRWSRGFLAGHDHLVRLWAAHLPGTRRGELKRLVDTLTFFAGPAHAPVTAAGDDLRALAIVAARELPAAMLAYARLGKSLRRTVVRFGRPKHAPASEGRTARNAPCPCGSGRKYKRCCLAKGQKL